MKIALINPNPSTYPPLGLVTVASHLVHEGHKVHVLEGTSCFTHKVDLIGIGGLTLWIKEIKELIKQLPQQVPIVVGGPCITSNPKIFHDLNVDYAVVGEGEETICELVDNLEKGVNPKGIKGLITKEGHNFEPRPFMDLSEKKIPAWHLLPNLNSYLAWPGLGIETSRGCPFKCCFCTAPFISGRKWRGRTAENVVEEIIDIFYRYKSKRIYFADDNCTVNPSRWKQLCKYLSQLHLPVEFHVPEGIQAHHLNMETLQLMKKAGFKSITIGAESGSQRILDEVINKGGLRIEQVEQVVKNCVKIGLKISCFFVIGTLGETLPEIQQTLAFARHLRKLGAESCSIRNALPIPGTRMWQMAKEGGNLLIAEEQAFDHAFVHSGKHFMQSEHWTPKQVEELTEQGQKENLWHVIKKHKWHSLKGLVRKFVGR
jgi:radical SAM superfamily enzyme YgiQ (UPF0313 family)